MEKTDEICCGICGHLFEGEYPRTGHSIICPNCVSEGFGTYTNDENMYYTIEWWDIGDYDAKESESSS